MTAKEEEIYKAELFLRIGASREATTYSMYTYVGAVTETEALSKIFEAMRLEKRSIAGVVLEKKEK